jgi:hypothetical protein
MDGRKTRPPVIWSSSSSSSSSYGDKSKDAKSKPASQPATKIFQSKQS